MWKDKMDNPSSNREIDILSGQTFNIARGHFVAFGRNPKSSPDFSDNPNMDVVTLTKDIKDRQLSRLAILIGVGVGGDVWMANMTNTNEITLIEPFQTQGGIVSRKSKLRTEYRPRPIDPTAVIEILTEDNTRIRLEPTVSDDTPVRNETRMSHSYRVLLNPAANK